MENVWATAVDKVNVDWENVSVSHRSKVKIVRCLWTTNALEARQRQNAAVKACANTTNVSACQDTQAKIVPQKLNALKIALAMVSAKMAVVTAALHSVDLIATKLMHAQMDVQREVYV